MSFSEATAYQRDFIAVKSRVLAAMMPCDRETSAAMQVVIVASQVGANAAGLAKPTGLAIERVRSFAKRLRRAKIWNGNSADVSEWVDTSYDRQRMAAILAQALVARGLLNREWIDEGAVYRGQRGNVLARFCLFEPFVDCLESLLDLESHGTRSLLSSTR